ncbi:MEKHLA domain-containing protein [Flaviflagellibacter deserti]|jgi:PAS domain-containing protein|uniref:MEKHLA domain-containing protein n=1 Tax=Flaviflagellibacter deserti TaxID=2267266 RepID=A0ABV9Z3N4_9HYPH
MDSQTKHAVPDVALDRSFFDLLTGSHLRIVGRPLMPVDQGPRWLYEHAPFVLLAHDGGTDPTFVYANRTAQTLFEYDWNEFVGLPSRLSAELPDRAERQRLLDRVAAKSFIDDYSGIRIAKSGRRFRIERAVVWQLIDGTGVDRGQAAAFSSWTDVT